MRETIAEPALDHATARAAMLAAIRFDAFPDAAPALRELREGGLRLVVASNWDCSLPEVLRVSNQFRLVAYGIGLLLIIRFLPDGLEGLFRRRRTRDSSG